MTLDVPPRSSTCDWVQANPEESAGPGRCVGIDDSDRGERTERLMIDRDGWRVLRLPLTTPAADRRTSGKGLVTGPN